MTRRRFHLFAARCALAIFFSLCSHSSLAADDSLDEVIFTGTRFTGDFDARSGIPLAQQPQSVQVITSDDIAALGAQSIGDLLRTMPSANAGYSRVGSFQSISLKVRGFLADQMRNGIRQRYYEDVDASAISNIDRVEVFKGPFGTLYGQSAVGGIVSIVTKQPDGIFGAAMSATVGSRSQKLISGDFRVPVSDKLGMRVTGEMERSGTFADFQDLDRENLAVTLRYEINNHAVGHLVAEYVERRTQRYPGLPLEGTVLAIGAGQLPRGLYLGEPAVDALKTDAPLLQSWVDMQLNDDWTLTPRLQYQEFNAAFTQIRLRGAQAGNPAIIDRDGRSGVEDDAYTIGQLDLSGVAQTGTIQHQLLLGYEYDLERGRFTQFNISNVTPINVLAPVHTFALNGPAKVFAHDTNHDLDSHALYAQDQIALTERWNVAGSVRQSWINAWNREAGSSTKVGTDVQSTIWQLGSTLGLARGISLYGGYSTGFDLESSGGARAATGEPLQPEESRQLEAGLRINQAEFRGSVAVFEIKRVNALTTDPLDPDFRINTGEQRVRGAELEGEWSLSPGWSISAGYALLKSRITHSNDGDQGLRLGDVPKHSYTLRGAYEVPGHDIRLRAGLAHASTRLLTNGSSTSLPGYTLLDASVSFSVNHIDIDLLLSNLADERYFTASGNAFAVMPGDPRNVQLRVGTRW